MAQVLYDVNGNPIIDPYQIAQATNRPPPEAPGRMTPGGQQANAPQHPVQAPQQTPQQSSTPPANPLLSALSSPGTLQALRNRLFGQGYSANQNTPANLASGGASGGGYQTSAPGMGNYYVGASPGAGQSGYIYPNQPAATAAGDVGAGASSASITGGMSAASKASLISMAAHTGDALRDYAANASWRMQQSAIPDPSQFQQQQQRYDFQRYQII